MTKAKTLALAHVDPRILTVRSERVMLDRDLAEVYGVTTKALNQAVKRNEERFPSDFRFQLTREERDEVVTNCDHLRNLKYAAALPWAFTEHGSIMATDVRRAPRAPVASGKTEAWNWIRIEEREMTGGMAVLQFWLFTLYDKDEMADLTPQQCKTLKAMIKAELQARRSV